MGATVGADVGAAVGADVGADVPDKMLAELRAKADVVGTRSLIGLVDEGEAATHPTVVEPSSPFSMDTCG